MEDIAATIAWVRAQGHQKVGAGATVSAACLTFGLTRPPRATGVGYYGVGIDNYLGEAGKAKKPVLLHIAEEDGFVSKDSQAKMRAALVAPNFTLHSYPGRDHAFARDGGKHYHKADAGMANRRTLDFFRASCVALPRSPRR